MFSFLKTLLVYTIQSHADIINKTDKQVLLLVVQALVLVFIKHLIKKISIPIGFIRFRHILAILLVILRYRSQNI